MSFKMIPFLDLLENSVDNRGKTCPTEEDGIPLIATNCIRNENLFPSFEKIRFVSQETYDNWFRGHPQHGDMIFVTKGTPGRVCWVPDPVNFCIAQDMVAVRANKDLIYPKYLFALLRSPQIQHEIENMHVGTLIPHFKKGDFDKLFLPVFKDYDTQKKIGDIYFTFCDKIELNRRMNRTLEEMAQALFRELCTVPAGAALPAGWAWKTIGDLYKTTSGGTPSRTKPEYFENGEYFWVKSKELYDTFVFDTEEKITESALENSSAKILPAYTLLVAMYGATVGQFSILGKEATCNQAICAILSNSNYKYSFIYSYLKDFKSDLMGRAVGSAQQNLSQVLIKSFEILCPPLDTIQAFQSLVAPYYKRILNNLEENRKLASLRDTLLPRLMSGALDIS